MTFKLLSNEVLRTIEPNIELYRGSETIDSLARLAKGPILDFGVELPDNINLILAFEDEFIQIPDYNPNSMQGGYTGTTYNYGSPDAPTVTLEQSIDASIQQSKPTILVASSRKVFDKFYRFSSEEKYQTNEFPFPINFITTVETDVLSPRRKQTVLTDEFAQKLGLFDEKYTDGMEEGIQYQISVGSTFYHELFDDVLIVSQTGYTTEGHKSNVVVGAIVNNLFITPDEKLYVTPSDNQEVIKFGQKINATQPYDSTGVNILKL